MGPTFYKKKYYRVSIFEWTLIQNLFFRSGSFWPRLASTASSVASVFAPQQQQQQQQVSKSSLPAPLVPQKVASQPASLTEAEDEDLSALNMWAKGSFTPTPSETERVFRDLIIRSVSQSLFCNFYKS